MNAHNTNKDDNNQNSKPSKLGRGLGALLSDIEDSHNQAQNDNTQKGVNSVQTLAIKELTPSDVQPRHYFDEEQLKALSESIAAQGVLQPLLVRKNPRGAGYEIIAGERRWRASQLAGLTELPVIIKQLDDNKALEIALVENIQRSDLNPIDEAAGYLRLVNEFNYTHEDMAKVTGKSRSHISNLLRLLSLSEELMPFVADGSLSMGHARALLPLNENDRQYETAQKIIKNKLSVRETEEIVRKIQLEESGELPRRTRAVKDEATKQLETRIEEFLGLDSSLVQKEGKGHLKVQFSSKQELTNLLNKLGL